MSGWDFKESTGLFEGKLFIEDCRFGTDARYGDAVVFMLKGRSPDASAEDDFEVLEFISIGNDWEAINKGKAVEYTGTGDDEFQKGTNFYRFIQSVFEAGGEDEVKSRGTPDDATIWNGLAMTLKRETITRKFKDGTTRDSQVLVCTEFHGEEEYGSPRSAASGSGKAAAAKAKAKAKANGSGDLRGQLLKLAEGSKTHDSFLETVFDKFPDIESADVWDEVLEEDGIFAEANG